MKMWYRRDGTPYESGDMLEIEKDLEDLEKKIVFQTDIWWGGRVSTVWLGLDHSFTGSPPLIFETMVFPANSYRDLDCKRYSTEKLAIEGHWKIVREWKFPVRHIFAILKEAWPSGLRWRS